MVQGSGLNVGFRSTATAHPELPALPTQSGPSQAEVVFVLLVSPGSISFLCTSSMLKPEALKPEAVYKVRTSGSSHILWLQVRDSSEKEPQQHTFPKQKLRAEKLIA